MISVLPEPSWYLTTVGNWRNCRVKAAIETFDSGVWGDDPYDDESATPVIRSNEIDEGGEWRVTTPALRLLSPQERKKARLLKGDLLIVKSSGSSAHIGKTAVVTQEIENLGSCFSNFTGRIRVNPRKTDSRFLWYFLNNSPGRDQLFYHGTTTTGLINLSATSIGCGRFFAPPLPEQQLIAAYLDASCAAIDSAVAAKRHQLETLDALASSIINGVVTRGCEEHTAFKPTGVGWFPEIPSEWRAVRFKSLFRLIYRYPTYFNIEYVPEGIPEVRGEALTPDGFIATLPDERYISSETAAQFPKTQLELGDIVMSVRGTMGKIGLVEERHVGANITANLLRLSPDDHRVTGEFLRWLMRSRYFNEALNSSAPQTTIKTITMPQLAKLRVALPPKSEQHESAPSWRQRLLT